MAKRLSKKQLHSIVSRLRHCDRSIMYAFVKGSVNLEEHISTFEERKTLWNRLSLVDDIGFLGDRIFSLGFLI